MEFDIQIFNLMYSINLLLEMLYMKVQNDIFQTSYRIKDLYYSEE